MYNLNEEYNNIHKHNFSAGPSALPSYVKDRIIKELQKDISIVEISHRSSEFKKILEKTKEYLRSILNIPCNYKILFCHGGARGHFAAIALNFLNDKNYALYVEDGYWSKYALKEASKFGKCIGIPLYNKDKVLAIKDPNIDKNAAYLHYCPNETVDGTYVEEDPNLYIPVFADCTSCLLTKPIDVSKYDLIYASAQKNLGIAGLTIVIINEKIIPSLRRKVPSILDYYNLVKHDSLYNTVPNLAIYTCYLVCKWLKNKWMKNDKGNVCDVLSNVYSENLKKAKFLYDYIDGSYIYQNCIEKHRRSYLNVCFRVRDFKKNLEEDFLKKADSRFIGIKGHIANKGVRVSLYNAVSMQSVHHLIKFMQEFEYSV